MAIFRRDPIMWASNAGGWQRRLLIGEDRRSAKHLGMLFMTGRLDGYRGTPKRTEQKLRICESKDAVTNNKRLRSRHCTVEGNYRRTGSISRGLSATAQLLTEIYLYIVEEV